MLPTLKHHRRIGTRQLQHMTQSNVSMTKLSYSLS